MKNEGRSGRVAFTILNNTAAFIGGEFFYRLVNFLSGILVARSLGNEHYGVFSFIFVYLSFFEIVVHFGFNSILVRELAQDRDRAGKILGNAILFRLVLLGVTVPSAIFLIRILGYPVAVQQGVLLASFQLFLTLRALYETIFRVHLLMIYPALVNGLRALVNLALVALIASQAPSVPHFILVYLGSGFIGLFVLVILSRRFISIRFEWEGSLIRHLVKESTPLVFSGYLTLLYYRVDVFMLSMMKSFSDVGYYSAATRLTESLDIISTSLMISLFPLLSRAFKEDRKEFERLLVKALNGLFLIGLPMALGGSLVAGPLIVFLFGEEYVQAGLTLAILFWYTFFGFFSTFLVNLLIVCGRQVVDAWVSFFLVLGNIGMNLLLIPAFSYQGAALATVLTEILGTMGMLFYVAKQPSLRFPFPFRELGDALKINALFFCVLILIKIFLPLHVLSLIFLGVLLYLLILFGTQRLSWNDFKGYLTHAVKALTGARP